MEALKERIRREGKNLGNGILKVDSFINHQVDPAMMLAIGGALAAHFGAMGINKVLTAEISGIAPALTTALALGVPVVYARKTKPVTMPDQVYRTGQGFQYRGQQINLVVQCKTLDLAPGRTVAMTVKVYRGDSIGVLQLFHQTTPLTGRSQAAVQTDYVFPSTTGSEKCW